MEKKKPKVTLITFPKYCTSSIVIPKPAIQCTFILNYLEKQHSALYIIQSMISAVVAGCLLITQAQEHFSLISRVHAVLLKRGFYLSKGSIGFSHYKKPGNNMIATETCDIQLKILNKKFDNFTIK